MKYSIFFSKNQKLSIFYMKKNLKRLKKIHSICTRCKGRYKNNCINKKT